MGIFFDGIPDIDEGINEVERVVKNGGRIIIVDNYGDDEFCSYSPHDISSTVSRWGNRGFKYDVIDTEFIFDTVEEAKNFSLFILGKRVIKSIRQDLNIKLLHIQR